MSKIYDAIIVGGGPAGLSAALYLLRAGYSVLIFFKDGGALEKADRVDNYFGFSQPVSGMELVRNGRASAARLGGELLESEVTRIEYDGSFLVTATAGAFRGKTLLVATGKSRNKPKISGIEEFTGRGVSFCAVCDGFFYRGKRVGVLGSGEYAAAELSHLAHFAGELTLFLNGQTLTFSPSENVRVVPDQIVRIDGEDRLSGLTSSEGTSYPLDGLFIAEGTAGAASFGATLGLMMNGQDIAVSAEGETNLPGLFAAGDCTGGLLQISKAVGEGALCATAMIRRLRKNA